MDAIDEVLEFGSDMDLRIKAYRSRILINSGEDVVRSVHLECTGEEIYTEDKFESFWVTITDSPIVAAESPQGNVPVGIIHARTGRPEAIVSVGTDFVLNVHDRIVSAFADGSQVATMNFGFVPKWNSDENSQRGHEILAFGFGIGLED